MSHRSRRAPRAFLRPLLPILLVAGAIATAGAGETPDFAWGSYGGDKGNSKYAPLSQIDASNVANLGIAWRWVSPDDTSDPKIRTYRFEATPIQVGDALYSSLSSGRVVCLDAATGEQRWIFDPKSYELIRRPTNLGWVHRGVAYFDDGADGRIIHATHCFRLFAINAKTGEPIESFGDGGVVDLTQGLRREIDRTKVQITSPPTICRGVAVVGSSIFDGPSMKEMPPGDVRGVDCMTGEVKWTFHTIPQPGEFGHETWEDGSWEYTGNTNVWTISSADEELGYVYLPIGCPTNDWYGGHRKGDNLFGSSIVCLKAETGERVWHFQMVHHDLWDYDNPAAPVLCDITVDGKAIKAVAQITKQSFTYVFDRVTGEPVWPIVEKPVPQTDVPGEKTSPTQPHPTKPLPYDTQGVSEDNIIDLTPELRAEAKAILDRFVHGPLFTPPSEKGTIEMPGWQGGGNWGGAAFDPETGRLFVPSISSPIQSKLGRPDAARSNFDFVRSGSMDVPAPKGGAKDGLSLFKPPWGRITAIDLNSGDHAWMIAHGEGPKTHPAIAHLNLGDLGSIQRGSVLATKTLLFAFEAAAGFGTAPPGNHPRVRAIDKATGKIVHSLDLPAFPGGSGMSYMQGGKQFVVVAIGGGSAPSEFVALALP